MCFIILYILLRISYNIKVHSITVNGEEIIDKINISNSSLKNMSGKNVTVAIIDTGININNYKDEIRIKKFKDFVNLRDTPYDDNGHGSKVATIIGGTNDTRGIAENCKFVIIKAFDYEGYSNVDALNTSLEWILQNYEKYNINMINMSLGVENINSFKHDKLGRLIEEIDSRGIIIVSAAGNGENNEEVMAPSSHESVICVGSMKENADGQLNICSFSRGVSKFSNKKNPNIYTYGSNITLWNNDGTMDDIVSGTSYSTAIVSGVICLLKEKNQSYSNCRIKKILIDDYAIDINGVKFIKMKK